MSAGIERNVISYCRECIKQRNNVAARNDLSTFHVLHPEEGCVLPALGGEIARAEPEVRLAVEKGLKQIQKAWADRLGSPDAAWPSSLNVWERQSCPEQSG